MSRRLWVDPRDHQLWEVWVTRIVQPEAVDAPLSWLNRIQFLSGAEHVELRITWAGDLHALRDEALARLLDRARGLA